MKKKIHDKKGGLGQAHLVQDNDICSRCTSPTLDIAKMDACLDNLTAAATQEKDVLDKLVTNNASLIKQLETLTSKFQQLSSQSQSYSDSSTPMLYGKKLKFVQHDKNGYCCTHGYRCTKGHTSKTCSKPGPNHQREATRDNTKGGSIKNKEWTCSHYEEKRFWVNVDRD